MVNLQIRLAQNKHEQKQIPCGRVLWRGCRLGTCFYFSHVYDRLNDMNAQHNRQLGLLGCLGRTSKFEDRNCLRPRRAPGL